MAEEADSRWRAWIAAGIALGIDARRKVSCPACGVDRLTVIDVPIPDLGKLDRWMVCPSCGARNVLTMTM